MAFNAERLRAVLCSVVRWRSLGRVRALSRWVFTWWSRAASLCLNRLSCRVCPSPSLWRPGEGPSAQVHVGDWWCLKSKVLLFLSYLRWNEWVCVFLELLPYSNLVGSSPADNFKLNCNFVFLPRHDALKLGKNFAKQTNCSVSDIVCLLSLTPQAVLAAQMKTSRAPQTPAYTHQI